jgi:Lipase (class 3)
LEDEMAFNAQLAILYGQFIEAAYTMFQNDPTNLTPDPSFNFPAGYTLTAWVHMQDFSISGSTGPIFYGFIAHNLTEPNQAVLAIRGTDNIAEWWADSDTLGMTRFFVPDCGNVGLGWNMIFETLEITKRPTSSAEAPQSLKPVSGRFSAQVADHLQQHAAVSGSAATNSTAYSIAITGHSLGAALATLCAAEDALYYKVPVSALYTFASPKVGDNGFVSAFNKIGNMESYRIVNQQDIVPDAPPGLYEHINTLQEYSSLGKVQQTVGCCHAMATYLSLIDPTRQPDRDCRLVQSTA